MATRLEDLEAKLKRLDGALRLREERARVVKDDPFAKALARRRGDVLRLRWGSSDMEGTRPE